MPEEFILSAYEGRSGRLGEGQGRHREVGSGGSTFATLTYSTEPPYT